MPAIAGHNSRVRIWQHLNDNNQGNEGTTYITNYIDMFATRFQFTYKTEAIDATTFEAPRVPFVTPMMTWIGGVTDIEFSIDALWDTEANQGNPYGFPDLRPGTRPIIDLYIKKGPNCTLAATMPAGATPGLNGSGNPHEQCIRFTAVIGDLTTDSEVRGLVKYSFSGFADPYIMDAVEVGGVSAQGEYFSTGMWLPSFSDTYQDGPAFSSNNGFHTVGATPQIIAEDGDEAASVPPNLKPTSFYGTNPAAPVGQELEYDRAIFLKEEAKLAASKVKAEVPVSAPEKKTDTKSPPPSSPLK
jgi:hypothetical protein